jgi:hypothetical protein
VDKVRCLVTLTIQVDSQRLLVMTSLCLYGACEQCTHDHVRVCQRAGQPLSSCPAQDRGALVEENISHYTAVDEPPPALPFHHSGAKGEDV